MKPKLCFVIQRYGEEINGGAEAYTRTYAELLAGKYDITVATTCALDYQEWRNFYPAGESELHGVKVLRFLVDKPRDNKRFPVLSQRIFSDPGHSKEEALEWAEAQGPLCSGLIRFLLENKDQFDLFLFFTYLYYPTVFGLPEVAEKAVLIPFCHKEPPVFLKCFDPVFHLPKGILFNTVEEWEFARKRFGELPPGEILGIGVPLPEEGEILPRSPVSSPYILYMGRIDPAKGCHRLFRYFEGFKEKYPSPLKLVLTGQEMMEVPRRRDIISLGFLEEQMKQAVLQNAELLVLPSHFESLSIVLLEAMARKKPVLVSGHSEVLKGHAIRSNGGLYFYGEPDFCDCLALMMESPALRRAMGENGRRYVRENYQWENILSRLVGFLGRMQS